MGADMKVLDRSLPALVVDDSRVMGDIMCRVLKQAGFDECESTTEGVDALLKLKTKRYGLLLTDLNMNPVSGIELIRSIWSDREIPQIPVVLTSGNYQSIAKAIAGSETDLADVYILKPFTAETLNRKLVSVFDEGKS